MISIVVLLDQRDAGFDPAGLAVGMVVEAVCVFIDSVVALRVAFLELSPRPCPALIGHAVLLLNLVGNIDLIEDVECIHTFHSFF